jgi:hypothetical protein
MGPVIPLLLPLHKQQPPRKAMRRKMDVLFYKRVVTILLTAQAASSTAFARGGHVMYRRRGIRGYGAATSLLGSGYVPEKTAKGGTLSSFLFVLSIMTPSSRTFTPIPSQPNCIRISSASLSLPLGRFLLPLDRVPKGAQQRPHLSLVPASENQSRQNHPCTLHTSNAVQPFGKGQM